MKRLNKLIIPFVLSFLLVVQSYSMLSMSNRHNNGQSEVSCSMGLLNKNHTRLQSMQNSKYHGGIDYDFHRPLHYGIIQTVEKITKANPLYIELVLRGLMLFFLFLLIDVLSGRCMSIWCYPLFATMYGSGFIMVGTKDIIHTVGALAVIYFIRNKKEWECFLLYPAMLLLPFNKEITALLILYFAWETKQYVFSFFWLGYWASICFLFNGSLAPTNIPVQAVMSESHKIFRPALLYVIILTMFPLLIVKQNYRSKLFGYILISLFYCYVMAGVTEIKNLILSFCLMMVNENENL